MTLTIDHDLDMVPVDIHVKFLVFSAIRVLTDRHTVRHTDRTDFITSTADTGGENSYDR